MSISYAPGAAFALVRPGVVVLLDEAVAPASVSAIWSALEGLGRPDGMADVLDTLTTVLDPSLRELPDFGVVVHESDPEGAETGVLHVVARGRVSVHLAGEAGSETIEAFDMTTWADKRFTDVDSYELAVGQTGVAADLSLALTTGVVTARSVSWVRPPVTADALEGAGTTSGAVAGALPGTGDETIDDDGLAAVVAEAHGAAVPVAEQGDEAAHADAQVHDGAADLDEDPAMVPVHASEPDFARTLGEFPDEQLDTQGVDAEDGAPTDDLVSAPTDETGDGAEPLVASTEPLGDSTPGGEPGDGEVAPPPAGTTENAAAAEPEGLAGSDDQHETDDGDIEHDGSHGPLPASATPPQRETAGSQQDEATSGGDGAAASASEADDDLDDTVFSLEGVRGVLAARAAAVGDDTPAPADGGAVPPAPVSAPAATHGSLPPVPPPPPEPSSAPQVGPADQQPGTGQPGSPSHAPYPVYQAAPQTPPGEAYPAATGPVPVPEQDAWPAPGPTSAPYLQVPEPQSAAGGPSAPASSGAQWTVQLPGTPGPADQVAPAPVPSQAPTILARSCAYGHANTPVRSTCAVCGGGLNPQAEVVPRPSLGRAVLSTGDVVELEQPVVLGRYPQAHVVTAQAQAPRLVTVPSPSQDISRSHLEIRLEGWNVLLVDLTTVNGTTLLRPGQPPRRLHPQEPTLVMDGDVADLGDGVRLTFEGLA